MPEVVLVVVSEGSFLESADLVAEPFDEAERDLVVGLAEADDADPTNEDDLAGLMGLDRESDSKKRHPLLEAIVDTNLDGQFGRRHGLPLDRCKQALLQGDQFEVPAEVR